MAANDLINVYDPTFWAQESLSQLFPMLKFAGMVHRQFDNIVASSGDIVNTRLPNRFSATTVDPDNFASVKPKADNVQVKMDTWKQVVFEIGDKEASLTLKDLQAEFAYPAAQAMAEAIEDSLIGLYKDTFYNVGAAGVTPATIAAISGDIKQKMDEIQLPESGRNVVLNPAATNKFNQLFYMDYVSGSPEQQTTGNLRPKFGMMYTDSNKLPKHIAGTAWKAGNAINKVAGFAANVEPLGGLPLTSTIDIDGLNADGTIKKGDLFTIDHGGTVGVKQYCVTADTAADGTGAVTGVVITPGLRANVADGTTLTAIASHDVNLAFQRDAFCLISRPMAVPSAPGASVAVVNFGGIGLRSSVWYEPKDLRTYVRLDALFGVKTLDARKAIRVLG